MNKKHKPYDQMNADELAEATRDLDKPMAFARTKPLTREQKGLLRLAARRGAGRPPIGKGAKKIHISVEMDLLKQVDAVARREKIARSELIARGLRKVI